MNLGFFKNSEKFDFSTGSRGYSGWRDNVDVPLVEKDEKYEIEILEGESIVRVLELKDQTFYEYTKELQNIDFGSLVNNLEIKIYQTSDMVGRGQVKQINFNY